MRRRCRTGSAGRITRTALRWSLPALLAIGALASCGEALPPLQTVTTGGSPDAAAAFTGEWYGLEGNPFMVVRARRSGYLLQIRLPPAMTLVAAEAQAGELHCTIQADGSEQHAVFRFVDGEPDMIWIGAPGPSARPSGCTWGYLARNLPIRSRATQALSRVAESCRAAHQGVMDWLIEHS